MKIRSLFWSPWTMVLVALALRLLVMAFVYPMHLDPALDHWKFGWEVGRVARSMVTGHGFSSPYFEPTGPTALVPPAYTYLLAGVFKLFGVYTVSSALVILTLNNLFASLTCLPVFSMARKVFGLRVAAWAGWTWALFPYSIVMSNERIWETSLTTLLLTLLVLCTLHLEQSVSLLAWVGYGLLWGLTALTSPATLSTLPFLAGWIWLRHRRRGSHCTGVAVAGLLAFLAAVTPWVWRSTEVYGRFVPFRGNLGLEILVGNSEDTSAPANYDILPWVDAAEMAQLRSMGEPAYMAQKQHEAVELIARRPLRFAGLTLRRILHTWTGIWEASAQWTLEESGLPHILTYTSITLLAFVGLRRAIRDRLHQAIPLVIPLVCFPVVYYVTQTDLGFRHPIDPLICIFMVYGVISFRRPKMGQDGK
jgi:4-amino-4-deoxy-L-arabinose transferase-like glycosyltransferase